MHLASPEKFQAMLIRSYQKGSPTMKTIVRSLVIALAVTGFAASSFANAAPSKSAVVSAKTSAMPVPRCPPTEPGDCGLSSW